MANPVTTKLNQLSSQYSAKVKRLRELKEQKRKPFATDAEVKSLNEEINQLTADVKKDFDDLAELKKLEKTSKEYTSLQTKIKEKQLAIAKAEARGESTTQLESDRNDLTSKFNSIAPSVEQAFPDIKVKPATAAKPGPMGNVQMTTGTTVAGTTESKAAATKKKAAPAPAVTEGQAPTCNHGNMVFRNGTSARGPWKAWMCSAPKGATDKCDPIFLR
jgi:hypothetical protein